MRCPECGCQEDKVVDSRAAKEGDGVRRRRECLNCGHRFTTYEGIIHTELKVIKKNRIREEFDRDKLRAGIERAFYKRPVSGEDVDRIVKKLISSIEVDFDGEVSSEEIGHRAMNEIKTVDEVAYVRFASVYRQFKDLDELLEEIKQIGTRQRND